LYYSNPSKKIFPEDFFGLPSSTKDIFTNLKITSERRNSRITEHPKLLNPLSPKNKKQFIGINSIKEENGEESITCRECSENNINGYERQYKNNQIKNNNNLNEEGDHSTSGSSKTQISPSKSNDSAHEVCKIFNKNDNTPIENDDMLKITPHFINEITSDKKKNIQLTFNTNNLNKDKKSTFARPLTPNLNIIRKSSAPISQNTDNKMISKNSNDNGNLNSGCEKNQNNENEIIEKIDKKIYKNKILNKQVIKTDSNLKRHSSFSTSKNIMINNNVNSLHTDSINKNNYYAKNRQMKSNKSNKNIYNSIHAIDSFSSSNKNKIPISYNSNRNMPSKNQIDNDNFDYLQNQKIQRRNATKEAKRNCNTSINKSIHRKKHNRNPSRQNNYEMIENNKLKPFKSENRITTVHSKVNDEINKLFSGLSENIAKVPEIHNKIECLIKDIKDIQQVVHRKTQSHFRPKK